MAGKGVLGRILRGLRAGRAARVAQARERKLGRAFERKMEREAGYERPKLSNLWALDASLQAVENRIKAALPSFEHVIEVNVIGGPQATMRSIWEVAVSIAMGRYRAAVKGPTGIELSGAWSYHDKTVGIRIAYTNSGVYSYLLGDVTGLSGQTGLSYMIKGPREETLGGRWEDFNAAKFSALGARLDEAVVQNRPDVNMGGQPQQVANVPNPNRPAENLAAQPPVLPDYTRLITTRAKGDDRLQPPSPDIGSYVLALVINTLSTPCYLPGRPPELNRSGQSSGVVKANENDTLVMKGSIRRGVDVNTHLNVTRVPSSLPADATGPDGYLKVHTNDEPGYPSSTDNPP